MPDISNDIDLKQHDIKNLSLVLELVAAVCDYSNLHYVKEHNGRIKANV